LRLKRHFGGKKRHRSGLKRHFGGAIHRHDDNNQQCP
jgi:hypothetical protein